MGPSASTKTGESLCRMLASQLCVHYEHSTVKSDLVKAWLEALPEPDESMMEEVMKISLAHGAILR